MEGQKEGRRGSGGDAGWRSSLERWVTRGRREGERGDEHRAGGDGRRGSGDEGDAEEENGTYIKDAVEVARGEVDANVIEDEATITAGEQAEVIDKEADGAEKRVWEDLASNSIYLDGDGGEGVIGVEAGEDIGAVTVGGEQGGENAVGLVALDRAGHEGRRLGRVGSDRERQRELDQLGEDQSGCRRRCRWWRARDLEGFTEEVTWSRGLEAARGVAATAERSWEEALATVEGILVGFLARRRRSVGWKKERVGGRRRKGRRRRARLAPSLSFFLFCFFLLFFFVFFLFVVYFGFTRWEVVKIWWAVARIVDALIPC